MTSWTIQKLAVSCFPSRRIKILHALCTNLKWKCSSVFNNSSISSLAQMPINQAHSRRLVVGQDGRFHVGHQGRTLQTKVLIKKLDIILIYMIDYYFTFWLNLPNIRKSGESFRCVWEDLFMHSSKYLNVRDILTDATRLPFFNLYWCLHYLVHRTPSKDNTGVVERSTIRRGLVKPVNLSSRYVNVGSPERQDLLIHWKASSSLSYNIAHSRFIPSWTVSPLSTHWVALYRSYC